LHRIVLVLFELIERILFLRRPRRRHSSVHLRIVIWYVHAKYGSEIRHLALLGLACLDCHWTHQRLQALCERSEAFLLHADALERVVVNSSCVGQYSSTRAYESVLLRRCRLHVQRFLHSVISVK
jgi:hypothetical protein